jgi:hypothetical protein
MILSSFVDGWMSNFDYIRTNVLFHHHLCSQINFKPLLNVLQKGYLFLHIIEDQKWPQRLLYALL